MFKEVGSIFSFLTILPSSSNSTLNDIAKYMYLFPIVGIIIGILVGSFGFGLSFLLDPIIVSFLSSYINCNYNWNSPCRWFI